MLNRQIHTSSRKWMLLLAGVVFIVQSGPALLCAADDEGLNKILEKHRRATFVEVSKYVQDNPKSRDMDDAFLWLFRAGLLENMEAEALPLAELYLERDGKNPALANLADRVRCVGLASKGDFDGALAAFEAVLSQARPQTANAMMGLGTVLARKARMAGDFETSRDVFQRILARFTFSRQVQRSAGLGLAKHDLIGQRPPKLETTDIDGVAVNLEDYRGKVVLVDFWATFCGPCIEELPNLKRVYEDLHKKGFEVIGVSLDEDVDLVKAFRRKSDTTWTQVMNDTAEGRIGDAFEAQMIPSLYLINRKGMLVQFDVFGDDLRTTVEQLLKEEE